MDEYCRTCGAELRWDEEYLQAYCLECDPDYEREPDEEEPIDSE